MWKREAQVVAGEGWRVEESSGGWKRACDDKVLRAVTTRGEPNVERQKRDELQRMHASKDEDWKRSAAR